MSLEEIGQVIAHIEEMKKDGGNVLIKPSKKHKSVQHIEMTNESN